VTTVQATPRDSTWVTSESSLNFLQILDQDASPLGSGATFTSDVIDLGPVPGYARWRVLVSSDQAGTCSLQQSPDGVTFYTTQANAYEAGGQAAIYESLVAMRYLQAQHVNGASAQTVFELSLALVSY
jgi:hypothetical protein